MKNLLAIKQSEENQRSNEQIRFQFIMAVMNLDERLLSSLLFDDSVFLGGLNKLRTAYWFKKQFEQVEGQYDVKLNEFISLDYYPGSEVLEFVFRPYDENADLESMINSHAENELKKITIRVVLSFDSGKIDDIRVPKKVMKKCKVKTLKKNN